MPPMSAVPSLTQVPDPAGHFGAYGGTFVPETLIAALQQLMAFRAAAQTVSR